MTSTSAIASLCARARRRSPRPALAALNVFATVPEWGALAEELGGDKVKVYVATNALQDPHHVEAKPSLIARARSADLVVATGAELEIGWLPLVTQQAGNPKIQPGKPGYFEAAAFVTLLEKPTRLDRAEGDVHPGGNPHIQTDPRNIARVAAPLAARLAELDPRERRVLPGALQGVRRALERGDRELGEAGGAAEGRADRRPAQGLHLPRRLARAERGRGARAQARRRADDRASVRGARAAAAAAGEDGASAPPTRATAHRNGSPSARRSTRSCCRSPSAATTRRRICTASSTTRSRACCKGAQ